MQPTDLLSTAKELLHFGHGKRPRGANLRRAVSSVYYALFHTLARNAADLLIGGTGSERSDHAWLQVYRALEHGNIWNGCNHKDMMKKFPDDIQDFANVFLELKEKREDADYNPNARFYKSDVTKLINKAEIIIQGFNDCTYKDKRAFVTYVLFKKNRNK